MQLVVLEGREGYSVMLRPYGFKLQDDKRMMNLKESTHGLIEILSCHLAGRTENYEMPVRMADVPFDIKTKHFLNTRQE
jgi:hypothetical protein